MAKKTAGPKGAAKKSGAGVPKLKNVVALRGTAAWAEWLNAYAASEGMPATVLIDQALRERAKRTDFSAPPSRTQEG